MADKETAHDESKDSNEVQGHFRAAETPDEDTEARLRADVEIGEKSEEDDVQGHNKAK